MPRRKTHEQPPEVPVVVTWHVVPWEEMPPAQRCAWDTLWRRLLSPPTSTNDNAPESASGASTICDTANEDPAADTAAP